IEVTDDAAEPLRLRVPPKLLSPATVAHLKQILGDHPGGSPVMLHLGEKQVVRLPEKWNVDTSNGLLGQLRVVLGAGAIVAWRTAARACSTTGVARGVSFDWTSGSLLVAERGLCRRCRSL